MSTAGRQRRLAEGVRREVASPPARPQSADLRRSPDPPSGHPGRPGARRGRLPAAARSLPGRPRRRVPGHRPGSVGGRAPGLRWRAVHPGADRRSEAGHLRLPRRRRLRLPGRRPAARTGSPCARTGAATQVCWRPTTPFSIPFTSAIPNPLPTWRPRPPTGGPVSLGGSGDAPLRARVLHAGATAWSGATRRACRRTSPWSGSPATWPPTSSRLLGSQRPVVVWRGAEEAGVARVSPGDIAVLVRTNRQAGLVQAALRAVGVPRSSGAPRASSVSPSARTGCASWKHSSSRRPGPRRRCGPDAVRRHDRRRCGRADEATWEAAARPPPPLGRDPAPAGGRHRSRAIVATEGLPARLLVGSRPANGTSPTSVTSPSCCMRKRPPASLGPRPAGLAGPADRGVRRRDR